MMIKKISIVLSGVCLCAALAIFLIPFAEDRLARMGHEQWDDAEQAYQWLVAGQRTNRQFPLRRTGLIPSHEGGEDCFVYDQALAALAFVHRGDYERARKLFSFFDGVRLRHIEEKGDIWGFTDVYKKGGRETETRAAGPAAWVLLALNYYHAKTGNEDFIPLARDIADWIISLQSIEGGIIGGFYGNGEPMTWLSSEHNFDCYAALRDLGILLDEPRYLRTAKAIKKWLKDDVWDADAQRFYLGRRNPNYATDISSWAVLSLGTDYEPSLDFAIEKSFNTQYYKVNNVRVEGFDFGATYHTSPFPDKDAVWFEGTAHMVLAFHVTGREERRDHFLRELDICLTASEMFPFTKGLPYASNEGTPVYDSWLMQDKPLCVSSTAWYYFAKKNFNPFLALKDLKSANAAVDALEWEPDYQFTPMVDDFEYTDIKFRTAYPHDLRMLQRAEVDLALTGDISVDGGHAMCLEFIPDEKAKMRRHPYAESFFILRIGAVMAG